MFTAELLSVLRDQRLFSKLFPTLQDWIGIAETWKHSTPTSSGQTWPSPSSGISGLGRCPWPKQTLLHLMNSIYCTWYPISILTQHLVHGFWETSRMALHILWRCSIMGQVKLTLKSVMCLFGIVWWNCKTSGGEKLRLWSDTRPLIVSLGTWGSTKSGTGVKFITF